MRSRPEELLAAIMTRNDLAAFLDVLSADAAERGSEWENLHIFDMLESMASWLRDSAHHDAFSHPDLSAEQWRFVAELMLAGKHYE
jgi:hypothetical protein